MSEHQYSWNQDLMFNVHTSKHWSFTGYRSTCKHAHCVDGAVIFRKGGHSVLFCPRYEVSEIERWYHHSQPHLLNSEWSTIFQTKKKITINEHNWIIVPLNVTKMVLVDGGKKSNRKKLNNYVRKKRHYHRQTGASTHIAAHKSTHRRKSVSVWHLSDIFFPQYCRSMVMNHLMGIKMEIFFKCLLWRWGK